jgi:hypothetical protein
MRPATPRSVRISDARREGFAPALFSPPSATAPNSDGDAIGEAGEDGAAEAEDDRAGEPGDADGLDAARACLPASWAPDLSPRRRRRREV